MNSVEAFNVLMSGKKVRNADWVKGAYIYYDKISFAIKDENSKRHSGMLFDKYFSNKQWELYEEDERSNIMNFEDAKKALLEGKKVRCKNWPKNEYIYFDDKNFLVKDENGAVQVYDINRFKKQEWELYEEPKKVIKVFISQPMRGRNKCEITEERNKIKKEIEKKYGEGYQIEYLNENLWERPKDWTRIQHLGYSIMNMYDADIVVFASNWEAANGCIAEQNIAVLYGKKRMYIDE